MSYTDINSKIWDRWVEGGIEWGIPISHETFESAKKGNWGVLLTPTKFVPHEWFLPFQGAKLLGLASGGGQQMPIFSALGAQCTVFDNSLAQLESERMVAEREGYEIEIVRGDMTKPLPFENDSFDMIFHPVSNCYIEEILPLWRECYRVLKPGGVLLAGFDNGLNYLIENDEEPLILTYPLPFNPLKHPEQMEMLMRTDDGVQFSHSLEEQLGGQLEAGLRLTHLYEDRCPEGEGALRNYVPQYMATCAVKPE